MSRLPEDPRFPKVGDNLFVPHLKKLYQDIVKQINALTEGRITAVTNAETAAPTAGIYQKGDFVRNSAPSEAGTAGSKYVVTGFLCVTAGTPGTWVQCRSLTGD